RVQRHAGANPGARRRTGAGPETSGATRPGTHQGIAAGNHRAQAGGGETESHGDTARTQQSRAPGLAYVASHDLQEPLRKVQAFGDRLKAACANVLGAEGRDYLERMQGAARRMQILIDDLLAFSRVTTKANPFEVADLNKIVGEVLSDLEVRIQQTNGQVELGVLPTLDADPLQMRQLFQNLIVNALKFHQEGRPPVVKIRSQAAHEPSDGPSAHEQANGVCRITVEDNGIGFDEKYLDRDAANPVG